MKNILIVSYLFAPANAIGAVRPTKFAKYLTKLGYNITVMCAYDNECSNDRKIEDIADISCIHRIKHSNKYKSFLSKINSYVNKDNEKSTSLKDRPIINTRNSKLKKYKTKLVRLLLTLYKDFDFYQQAKEYVKNNNINLSEVDVIFSTFGPSSNHYIARYIKKINNKLKWIADFRDPMSSEYIPFGFKGYIKYIQNNFCRKSDFIIAVSKGYLEQITKGKYTDKSFVITNGYDSADINVINNERIVLSKKLVFLYAGATYQGKRDLSPLFRAINELINENKIDKNNIEFLYAGREGKYVRTQADMYNCDDIVIDLGYVSREKSLMLQNLSNILVVTTWNEKQSKGVLPGKFFEYMLFEKPIIGIVSGSDKNSEISDIIYKCKLGITYEQAGDQNDFKCLKKYVLDEYNSYISNNKILFNPLLEEIKKYNYTDLTLKLMEIVQKISN